MNVEPTRRRVYDSRHRQATARANRRAMLEAARDLFLRKGYAATTIADVAAVAGVSVPTVNKVFANKAGLLKAVFDVAVAGDDEPVPMQERAAIQAVIAEPDAAEKLRIYCRHLTATMPRVAPVQLLARDAAASDAGAAAVWAQLRAELLAAMTAFAHDLAATGQLAVPTTQARDLLWTFHSPELYELLVLQRGWSARRYGAFLTRQLIFSLLTP